MVGRWNMKSRIREFMSSYSNRFRIQPCPNCGRKCISYLKKCFLQSLWYDIRCPECGAELKLGIGVRLLWLILYIFTIVYIFFISGYIENSYLVYGSYAIIALGHLVITPFAKIKFIKQTELQRNYYESKKGKK